MAANYGSDGSVPSVGFPRIRSGTPPMGMEIESPGRYNRHRLEALGFACSRRRAGLIPGWSTPSAVDCYAGHTYNSIRNLAPPLFRRDLKNHPE